MSRGRAGQGGSVHGPLHASTGFDAGLDAPCQARDFVRNQLVTMPVPEPVLADLLVIVSELVSNAVQHGAGDPRLELHLQDERIRVDVGDDAVDLPPAPRALDQSSARGRGLLILAAMADRWGHDRRGQTKWIWAEISTGRALSGSGTSSQ